MKVEQSRQTERNVNAGKFSEQINETSRPTVTLQRHIIIYGGHIKKGQ